VVVDEKMALELNQGCALGFKMGRDQHATTDLHTRQLRHEFKNIEKKTMALHMNLQYGKGFSD